MSNGRKQQTAAGLFFSMLLRAGVVIMGIAILVFGSWFVLQAVKGAKGGANAPATTLSDNALTDADVDELLTVEVTEEGEAAAEGGDGQNAEATDVKNMKILVLNSTDIAGLAGRWCETLNADGYANTNASDYSEALTDTKIVSKHEGVGENLKSYFASATYEVGEVTSGTTEPATEYDIVIIIGASDSNH